MKKIRKFIILICIILAVGFLAAAGLNIISGIPLLDGSGDGALVEIRDNFVFKIKRPSEPRNLLILVNKETPLPDDYKVDLKKWDKDCKIAEVMYKPLKEMFEEMQSLGLSPKVNSAYRKADDQTALMEQYIDKFMDEDGIGYEAASTLALKYVSLPGTSEHETGLAVDISSEGTNEEMFAVYYWLQDNAWKYGFIKRYLPGKEDITGYAEELWHYRYVGPEPAEEIFNAGITLEEYLEHQQH